MYAELRFRVLFFSPHFFLGHDELYISLIGSTCMFLLNSIQLRSTTTWIHVREELAPLKGWTSFAWIWSCGSTYSTLPMVHESTSESASLGNRISTAAGAAQVMNIEKWVNESDRSEKSLDWRYIERHAACPVRLQ